MAERPQWFNDFWGTATTYFLYTEHEEMMETALGTSRLVDEGKLDEALKLIDQVKAALILERVSGLLAHGGEKQSNQLIQMILCGLYPEDLSTIAAAVVAQKYPEIRAVSRD